MKKTGLIFFLFIGSLVIVSCQKDFTEDEKQNTTQDKTLENGEFSPSFTWETARNITFNLTSSEAKNIYIKSKDGETRYYHCQHPGQNETLKIRLNLPVSVEYVQINNMEVAVSSGTVNQNLNN
jgi:hypothetical protein